MDNRKLSSCQTKTHDWRMLLYLEQNAVLYIIFYCDTWDIKPFVPWTKSNFLKGKKFNCVSDFARWKKLRTKTDFDLILVEGSKLRTKSDYNCRRKSRKKIEYVVRE